MVGALFIYLFIYFQAWFEQSAAAFPSIAVAKYGRYVFHTLLVALQLTTQQKHELNIYFLISFSEVQS